MGSSSEAPARAAPVSLRREEVVLWNETPLWESRGGAGEEARCDREWGGQGAGPAGSLRRCCEGASVPAGTGSALGSVAAREAPEWARWGVPLTLLIFQSNTDPTCICQL